MPIAILETSFSSIIPILVWCVVPLYGTLLGLALNFLDRLPSLAIQKNLVPEPANAKVCLNAQFLLFGGAISAVYLFRGFEGSCFQGQLYINFVSTKLSLSLVAGLIAALTAVGPLTRASGSLAYTNLGFTHWAIAPLLISLWLLLPLMTQLSTALLLLELIGVALIWALTSIVSPSNTTLAGGAVSPLNLIYALIIFIWASGLSALSLLLGIGFSTLDGTFANYFLCMDILSASGAPLAISDLLLTVVLMFKFLIGGGQFLLLSWYRFLPFDTLIFYLFFYYPAHLLVGTTMFAGFFLPSLATASVLILVMILVAAVSLLAHLGVQTSPALTLAGSSFVGLSFLAISLVNL